MIDDCNIDTTGSGGESSEDYCSNCNSEFNETDGVTKCNKFKWFDPQTCAEKDVDIMEAAAVVFEGLLHMNGKQMSPNESLSMCLACIENIYELYRNYKEFLERSAAGSYFRELFPSCMLWQSTITEIEKCVVSMSQKPKILNKSEDSQNSQTVESLETTEDDHSGEVIKEELLWNDKIENEENYCDKNLHSDNEHVSKIEPLIVTTKSKRKKRKKIRSIHEMDPEELPQFLNGEWILPKAVKIVLNKYVPGDPNTLDIGKTGRKLVGKTIKVDQNSDLIVEITCKSCYRGFANMKNYFNHIRVHKENKKRLTGEYPCSYCGKIYPEKYKLLHHKMSVHKAECPFECDACGKTFPLKETLSLHVKHFHENDREESRTTKDKCDSLESSHPNEMDTAFCDLCQMTFSSPQAKDVHHQTVHLKEKPLTCKYCDRGFILEINLRRHEQSHLEIKKSNYNCTQCDKPYSDSQSLKEHMASAHAVLDPRVCEECGKTCATPKRLLKHKFWVHSSKGKICKCEQCGKILKNQHTYLDHMTTHKNERPYLCTVCGMAFKRRNCLRKHTIVIHKQNAAATCQKCEKGFLKISDYEEHMAKGFHMKPKWLRPPPKYKRNLNAPGYLKGIILLKLERQLKRLEKNPNATIEMQLELKKEAEEKLKLLKVRKRREKLARNVETVNVVEPVISISTDANYDNLKNENDEYGESDESEQWEQHTLLTM